MELHFDQELNQLKDALLRLSGQAEENVAIALKALALRDLKLARSVDAADNWLDRQEMEIDERCIQLLALRQPKARDLRFITMAMKIASELERIGDQAVNIAHRAEDLIAEPLLEPLNNLQRMAEIARGMIHESLDAFVYTKPELARQVIRKDEEVDALNREFHRERTAIMLQNPAAIARTLHFMSVARNLERIADHATNIAEEVVYLCEGRDIRHQPRPPNG